MPTTIEKKKTRQPKIIAGDAEFKSTPEAKPVS